MSGHEEASHIFHWANKRSVLVKSIRSVSLRQACSTRWKTGPHHIISSLAIHRILLRKSLLLMTVCFPSMLVWWSRALTLTSVLSAGLSALSSDTTHTEQRRRQFWSDQKMKMENHCNRHICGMGLWKTQNVHLFNSQIMCGQKAYLTVNAIKWRIT